MWNVAANPHHKKGTYQNDQSPLYSYSSSKRWHYNLIKLIYLSTIFSYTLSSTSRGSWREPFCTGFSQEGLDTEMRMQPSFPLSTLVCCCFINPEKVKLNNLHHIENHFQLKHRKKKNLLWSVQFHTERTGVSLEGKKHTFLMVFWYKTI